ncbi:hypothetical protein PIB30_026347 [Stylosanthes scabra]|uniref:Ankyrin repeat domain-containing protein n=1 Tax=Stylosanthes scabra TaxID=79078 RepID=A0ABU6Z9V8_9FABA|nr:hypothetical protein [Stylosanthes scabra]
MPEAPIVPYCLLDCAPTPPPPQTRQFLHLLCHPSYIGSKPHHDETHEPLFPSVAIPVVPTIRVLVTFTKFEELQAVDEFATPPSSPSATGILSPAASNFSASSWFQWIKAPYRPSSSATCSSSRIENVSDPFAIPSDYTWVTAEAKKKRMQEKNKSKKGKNHS